MAKVRVQASIKEDDDLEAVEEGKEPHKPRAKYSGAVDVLKKVLAAEGFLGWYQVGFILYLY